MSFFREGTYEPVMEALPERASVREPVVLTRVRLRSVRYYHHFEDPPTLELVFDYGITVHLEGRVGFADVGQVEPGADYAISIRKKDRRE